MVSTITFQEIEEHPIVIGEVNIYLVWFDSYGAKSSCVFIETPDLHLLVDPGAAAMQSSYPLDEREGEELKGKALETIARFSRLADTVFISHYHYDHHVSPLKAEGIYRGKGMWIKDPNRWINHSQWERARTFIAQLYEINGIRNHDWLYTQPGAKMDFSDPTGSLPMAMAKDYGDYQQRKNQLIDKGRAWFKKMALRWKTEDWISEAGIQKMDIQICDGRSFKKGSTFVRFTEPMFHGIEFDRVGWVVGVSVEHKGRKVIYTSDLQGPSIEDYAQWIIKENPDILILDGPPTYLFGFMVNRINLQRAIDNVCAILRGTTTNVIIYDHHLLRDARYKERVGSAYTMAGEHKRALLTAAEWLGYDPLIVQITQQALNG
ncbi:MAG: MBL fold metallo-hydrolase [Deltaproteobacteria bacterium]|nr:MAG: MBL fold metallo-hydrolase [Deltaproteobacteria bacterium]